MTAGTTRHKLHLMLLFLAVATTLVILYIGRVAEIVIIAALLAYILDPVVTSIETRGVSRSVAAALIMLLLTVICALFWYTVIPIAIAQFKAMQAGSGATPAQVALTRLEGLIHEHLGFAGLGELRLSAELDKLKSAFMLKVPDFLLKDSFSVLLGLIMIPFIMFFLLKDARAFKKYFISLVPNRYFEFTLDLLYKMETQLGNYLRGQFLDATIFGVLATATLWMLDVPYFVFIGIFAGLANLIPFVGPLAGALAALVAVVFERGDIVGGMYVLLAFAGLKMVDDFVIQPLAVGKNVDLHPMVVMIAIIVGGHLFGILGMLLVIPFLGFLRVVLEESVTTYRRYRFD